MKQNATFIFAGLFLLAAGALGAVVVGGAAFLAFTLAHRFADPKTPVANPPAIFGSQGVIQGASNPTGGSSRLQDVQYEAINSHIHNSNQTASDDLRSEIQDASSHRHIAANNFRTASFAAAAEALIQPEITSLLLNLTDDKKGIAISAKAKHLTAGTSLVIQAKLIETIPGVVESDRQLTTDIFTVESENDFPDQRILVKRPGMYTVTILLANSEPGKGILSTKTVSVSGDNSLSKPEVREIGQTSTKGEKFLDRSEFLALPILLFGDSAEVTVVSNQPDRRLSLQILNPSNASMREVIVEKSGVANSAVPIATGRLEGGTHLLKVVDLWSGRASDLVTLRVNSQGIRSPEVTAVSNLEFSQEFLESQKGIFSYGGYLRLRGNQATSVPILNFPVYARVPQTDGAQAFVRMGSAEIVSSSDLGDGIWETELNILQPESPQTDRRVFALSQGNDFAFSSQPVSVTVQPGAAEKTQVPSITKLGERSTEPGIRAFHNVASITLSGTFGTLERSTSFSDTVVAALTNDGQIVGVSGRLSSSSGGSWSIPLKNLSPGDHTLRVAFARGNAIGARSAPLELTIRTTGPHVIAVDPPNLGTAPGVQKLVISFSPENPLDHESAGYVHNYLLLSSGGTGAFNRGNEIAFRPESADHVSASNTVELKFPPLPADIYQLRVNAHPAGAASSLFLKAIGTNVTVHGAANDSKLGIRDIYGNYLSGNDGTPNTDYILALGNTEYAEGTEFTSRRSGLPSNTGPPVDYPEYTEPRQYPGGVNPSDKVVSRVARLYYFRDAHRVAQIINRRSQSFNAQNASMSRQLADQARLFAEEQIDKRRDSEFSSVEAARLAREAENSMAVLQQSLAQARGMLQQATTETSNKATVVTDRRMAVDDARRREESARNAVTTAADDAQKRDTEKNLVQATDNRLAAERALAAAETELGAAQQAVRDAQAQVTVSEQRINATAAAVQSLREQEVEQRRERDQAQAREDRAIDRQFRLEVTAATEDPDTYAPGNPKSDDPVAQVTMSVIGEGLIQLRGPLKGVNIVRTMINEIDSPVGQVRVGVHTVQINGERGERMEEVAGRIQRQIDHSRFLTSQSAQMLRNSIVQVASQRAQQIYAECLLDPQHARDQKYQDAFFGKDFMDELRQMDSEFLKTGNKLLSLHSMDSTSLASALFLLGLASNDTRLEIISVFESMLTHKLPLDEHEYFLAAGPQSSRCQLFHTKKNAFQLLGQNARFVSFRGYFDHQVSGPETLNPVQREFIRLAQIFKSRLITEVELKQRVIERTLIEERIGDYNEQLRIAAKREESAVNALALEEAAMQKHQTDVMRAATRIAAYAVGRNNASMQIEASVNLVAKNIVDDIITMEVSTAEHFGVAFDREHIRRKLTRHLLMGDKEETIVLLLDLNGRSFAALSPNSKKPSRAMLSLHPVDSGSRMEAIEITVYKGPKDGQYGSEFLNNKLGTVADSFAEYMQSSLNSLKNLIAGTNAIVPYTPDAVLRRDLAQKRLDELDTLLKEVRRSQEQTKFADPIDVLLRLTSLSRLLAECARDSATQIGRFRDAMEEIVRMLALGSTNVTTAHERWVALRLMLSQQVSGSLLDELKPRIDEIDQAFSGLLTANLGVQFAQKQAEASRRPLDHKKFLDMLIDETEEKFIELVEGSRAHTAVIDDYVKRLSTALEDDFNTQFYEPAFRQVREQAYGSWDVSLGQIEHTTILTNNRAFAKVLPQATMEFDLPKRDILINEAFQSAAAAYADYGALLGDPSFLALTKLYSGQPTSAMFGSDGPAPLVRDVLPGLPSQTDESLLMQAQSGQPQFASQLEALIPDPAVYKFETGTGFEIRPVIQPDGQSVVFNFNYMYTTNIREPVRADEKHLGRVKRHFINTDVQIGNYELREISRYRVALKASRTSRGVPFLEDVPVAGALFRPLPQDESSLQQNMILAHSVIYPTLFDLMGLRWAPAVADLDAAKLIEDDFVFRNRMKILKGEVYDYSSEQVDEFLRIPQGKRRRDLYRLQETVPYVHPNGYQGPGLDRQDSQLQEGYDPASLFPPTVVPTPSGAPLMPLYPQEVIPSDQWSSPVENAPQQFGDPKRRSPADDMGSPAGGDTPPPTSGTLAPQLPVSQLPADQIQSIPSWMYSTSPNEGSRQNSKNPDTVLPAAVSKTQENVTRSATTPVEPEGRLNVHNILRASYSEADAAQKELPLKGKAGTRPVPDESRETKTGFRFRLPSLFSR